MLVGRSNFATFRHIIIDWNRLCPVLREKLSMGYLLFEQYDNSLYFIHVRLHNPMLELLEADLWSLGKLSREWSARAYRIKE